MNTDQLAGIARVVVPAVCAWLAAQGWTLFGDAAVVAQVTAVVIGLGAIVWSFVAHTNSNKVASAAAVDERIKITIPKRVIADDPSLQKVVDSKASPNVNNGA